MVLYAEAIVVFNFAVNAALLYGVAAVTGRRPPAWRLLGAAAAGAAYGLSAFTGRGGPAVAGVPALVAVSIIMVAVTFWPFHWSEGAVLLVTMYGLAAAVAGGVLAFTAAGGGGGAALAVEVSGPGPGTSLIVGRPFSPGADSGNWAAAIIGCAAAVAAAGGLFSRVVRRTRRGNLHTAAVRVLLLGEVVRLVGRIDTGHDAADPLDGSPVLVAEARAFRSFMPRETASRGGLWGVARQLPPGGREPDGGDGSAAADPFHRLWPRLARGPLARRVRLFPFRSLGREHGLLPAVRSDAVEVEYAPGRYRRFPGAVVALYPGRLGVRGRFDALIPLDMVAAEERPHRQVTGRRPSA